MTRREPAVLHVVQPSAEGVPRVANAYVRDQHARGWRVGVATPQGSDLHRFAEELAVPCYRWDAQRSPWKGVVSEARRLASIQASFKPDIVHLHSAKAGLIGRLLLRGRTRTVYQPHAWSFLAVEGPVERLSILWERYAAGWTDCILCVSDAERRLGEHNRIRAEYRVIPNGIDLDWHRHATPGEREAARRRLSISDSPLAICVGRLARQKGQDVLLRAWRHVQVRMPEAKLILVGEGPLRGQLEADAPAGVAFAGSLQDTRDWYAAANVVVTPSRWEAGVPLVALEAMAAGRRLVISDVAGVGTVLGPREARVLPPEDADALAETLVHELRQWRDADALGMAARELVERSFDLRKTTAHVAMVLSGLARAA